MAVKVAINGFGRIGRLALRQILKTDGIEVVAVNDLTPADMLVHLFKYDTTQGRFNGTIEQKEEAFLVNGKEIKVFAKPNPEELPWKALGVDVVLECTGFFTSKDKAEAHIRAGARKVVISAPAGNDMKTVVFNVNHNVLDGSETVISAASCTTNCLAPLCKVINDNWGIEQGLMSTIHAATAKQKVVDARSMKDWRTGRSVFNNIIPTTTGAAKAVSLVIPELEGKLTGKAYRVPTANVSVIDLNLILKNSAKYEEICAKVKEASENEFKGIIEYVDDEVVSCDFIGDPCTCIYDAREGIELNDKFFKFITFYDNEFGYSVQLLRLIQHMSNVDNK